MNCKQAEELLPLYAGRDLDDKRATLVTEHLQTCAACARVADEYRESVQLTEQFAPPVFSEAVYAGIRQRVLREIETDATASASSQTIASLFRPGLAWAVARVLLLVVSVLAIYFVVNRRNHEQQVAVTTPAEVQPGTKEHANSGPPRNKRSDLPRSVNTGGKKLAVGPKPQRKRLPLPSGVPEPVLFPHRDSAASNKTLRVEIQTKDPNIRIIWFVQQDSKPVNPGSKGT